MKLSLIVPCYNEEENIRPFHDAVVNAFRGENYDYEIVFVNDGSRDNTLGELKKLYSEVDTPLRILSFSRNFGKEAAMRAGLEHATGDLQCLIDADLQQRPEVVVQMVRRLDECPELDCVAAYQAQRSEDKKLSFFKERFYAMINDLSDVEFRQDASDFRTFRKPVADAVLSLNEYHRFSKGLLSWVGFNTEYMPYEVQQRAAGESKWSFTKLLQYAIDGIVSFSTMPLRLPTLLGASLCVVSLLMLLANILVFIAKPTAFSYDSLIIFLIVLLSGLQFLCIGILGKYLAQTFEQSKNRPHYLLKEVIEPKSKQEEKEEA
ncbi:MAG: glycosyltransferase family 2 protein [Clostridia bacterium]|nr:glycosyltransferase family 2 protein [Clostridia bacterium]